MIKLSRPRQCNRLPSLIRIVNIIVLIIQLTHKVMTRKKTCDDKLHDINIKNICSINVIVARVGRVDMR